MAGKPCLRLLLEWCAEETTLLGAVAPDDCEVIQLTREDDATSSYGREKAQLAIRRPGTKVGIWASMPCTGGSKWIRINLLKEPSTVEKIKGHWRLFRQLWSEFIPLAEECLRRGGGVSIEWPGDCLYWKDPRVVRFLVKHGFFSTVFDGCMYGLKSVVKRYEGIPIRKPWRVDSSSPHVGRELAKRCDNTHNHIRCGGGDTIQTQGYTLDIAKRIHNAFHSWSIDPHSSREVNASSGILN